MTGYRKRLSDRQADLYLFIALAIFTLSIVSRPLALFVALFFVARLTILCDVKVLPALMLLMFDKANIRAFAEGEMAIRLGITVTSASMFTIMAFLMVACRIITGRYDRGSMSFVPFWLLMLVPAVLMSWSAKQMGLSGIWSGPIMNFLVPAIYYWGLDMGDTIGDGLRYFIKRMMIVVSVLHFLNLPSAIVIFSSWIQCFSLAVFVYVVTDNRMRLSKFLAFLGLGASFLSLLLSKYFVTKQNEGFATNAEMGSTFNQMASYLFAGILAWFGGPRLSRYMLKLMVVAAMIIAGMLVSYVIGVRQDREWTELFDSSETKEFQSISDRFRWKLIGDRGSVWSMGWRDATTPPYFIRDLSQRIDVRHTIDGDKMGIKLLPHNQIITLLVTDGWLQGLIEIVFLFWVLFRTIDAFGYFRYDNVISVVIMPVFISVFLVMGVTGQSVYGSALWGNAVFMLVLPGAVYGNMVKVKRMRIAFTRG